MPCDANWNCKNMFVRCTAVRSRGLAPGATAVGAQPPPLLLPPACQGPRSPGGEHRGGTCQLQDMDWRRDGQMAMLSYRCSWWFEHVSATKLGISPIGI